jgi:hypothetical protein
MNQSGRWGHQRYMALVVVLALHLALFAALLMASRTKTLPGPAVQSVELLFLPPVSPPKVRAENTPPKGFSGSTAVTAVPPRLDLTSMSTSPLSASSSDGSGSGVDWAAEARRALHAFEIRNHQLAGNNSISIRPEEDNWWPHGQRRAGEHFKTANGDWIVWINASCYQVASSGPSTDAANATLLEATCPTETSSPLGN